MSSNTSESHGLDSSLEPLILQRRVPLVSPKPDSPLSCPENQRNCLRIGENTDSHQNEEQSSNGWNFIQTLTNTSRNLACDSEHVYVRPLSRISTFALTTRSLETCTESLGSENGTRMIPCMNELLCVTPQRQGSSRTEHPKTLEFSKRSRRGEEVPPPPPSLTSIRGSHCLDVETHREDGRLVIRASRFSSCRACFRAERGNGRIRLSFLRDDCGHESWNEADSNGCLKGETPKEDEGKAGGRAGRGEWSGGRCVNGDGAVARGCRVSLFAWPCRENPGSAIAQSSR